MDIFEIKKKKKTKPRMLVYNIIEKENEVSIKNIISKLENDADKSTIYRIIELFLEKNIIDKKVDENKNIYYIIHENKHIHYMNCNICHKKDIISNEAIDKLEKEVINNDFIITSHDIEFRGICKDCRKKVSNE